MKRIPAFLIVAWLCNVSADDTTLMKNRGANTNRFLDGVFVEGAAKWHSLAELDLAARNHLSTRFKEFDQRKVGMSIWIQPTNSLHSVLICYNSGLGLPYWNVY